MTVSIDGGGENNRIADIQKQLWGDDGVRVAVSVRNTAVERPWRDVGEKPIDTIKAVLGDLEEQPDAFDFMSKYDKCSLWEVYNPWIEDQLAAFRTQHNYHKVRKSKDGGRPSGLVDLLFEDKCSGFNPVSEADLRNAVSAAGLGSIQQIAQNADAEFESCFPLNYDQRRELRLQIRERPFADRDSYLKCFMLHKQLTREMFL